MSLHSMRRMPLDSKSQPRPAGRVKA
jgi:hypothetical protein